MLHSNYSFRSKFEYNVKGFSLPQCLKYSMHVYLTNEKRSQVDCIHTLC